MKSRGYMIMLHRDGALESRQLRVAGWLARLALVAGSIFVICLVLVAVFYGPTVRAATRTPFLDREVARLKAENARVTELARRLDEVEARYAQLRGMLGPNVGLPEPAAAGGGRVKQTGTDSAYGEFVLLQHPSGYETMYGHLSRVVVQQGAMVRAGQVIGLSGSTGRSTAPHLHFEIRRGGQSVDPLTMVREGT